MTVSVETGRFTTKVDIETYYAPSTRKILCECSAVIMPMPTRNYDILDLIFSGRKLTEIIIRCQKCKNQYRVLMSVYGYGGNPSGYDYGYEY